MKSLAPLIEIADLHANRMLIAIEHLKNKIPVSADEINHLPNDELPYFELYASRFSKLQDFLGSNLFTALLEHTGEQTESMTFIDKLNKLEKLQLIISASEWMKMRQIRNILAHEYPDRPEITANIFNNAFSLGPVLLDCLEKLKRFLKKRELI
jgi:flagellar motor switch protein FliG